MTGAFNPAALPDLPGVYTKYTAAPSTVLPPSAGAIVAIPVVHDWGPDNVVELLNSFDDWESQFGPDDTPGRRAVYDAFRGEGLPGLGGAAAVYVLRMATEAAAQAVIALKNPAAATAVTLHAKWKGTRGNRLKITVTPAVEGKQTVVLLDGTAELESFQLVVAESGALKALVTTINSISPWLVATLSLEGTTGLAAGTFSLSAGDDGLVLTGETWINAANAFNNADFAYFAPYDLPWAPGEEGATVRTTVNSLKAWCDYQNEHGHRFTLVVGGALDEDPVTAISRAQEMKDPNVITIGGPGVNDALFGARSTAQLAPRIAGIRAQRGESQSAHFARLAGTLPRPKSGNVSVTLNELSQMVANGVLSLQRDRFAAAPVRIVKDVNTWAPLPRTLSEEQQPKRIYGNPKFVQSMQQFANDAEKDLEVNLIGKVTVNDSTRQACAGRVLRLAAAREKTGAFSPGVKVTPLPGKPTDEFVILKVEITFGRALAQLFLEATVS